MDYKSIIDSCENKDFEFKLFQRRIELSEALLSYDINKYHLFEFTNLYREIWKIIKYNGINTRYKSEEESFIQLIINFNEKNVFKKILIGYIFLIFNKIDALKSYFHEDSLTYKMKTDLKLHFDYMKLNTNKTDDRIILNENLKKYLNEKYKYFIENYKSEEMKNVTDYKMFVCWLQGKENMPEIVKMCYNILEKQIENSKYKLILIDNNNYKNYVNISDRIIKLYENKFISPTHFADILRMNLLYEHGGVWIDSTILLSKPVKEIENYLDAIYFSHKINNDKNNKTYGYNIDYGRWTSMLQCTNIIHNPLFGFVKDFFNEYFKDNYIMLNYFFIDFIIDLAYDNIIFVKDEIDKVPVIDYCINIINDNLNKNISEFDLEKELNKHFMYKFDRKLNINYSDKNNVYNAIYDKYLNNT